MDEPHLSPRKKRFADYMLANKCTALVAYRATRDDGAPPKAGDKGNAAAMHKACAEYLDYHRKRIAAIVDEATKPELLTESGDNLAQRIARDVLSRLRDTAIETAHVIAYCRDVLTIGADQILADVMGPAPKLSYLVESYELTETIDPEGNVQRKAKIKTMSKKDAIAQLRELKAMKHQEEAGSLSVEVTTDWRKNHPGYDPETRTYR